jgi:hypothetical protein
MYASWKQRARGLALCVGAAVLGVSLLTGWVWLARPQLGPDYTQQAWPGEHVLYAHVLTNTGDTTDTFMLAVASTQGWAVTLLGDDYPAGTAALPLRVGAGMTAPFQVSLTVPSDAGGVTERTRITATSQLSPAQQATAIDTTHVDYLIDLPFIVKRWPPLPYPTTLNAIENTDGDGTYTITWLPAELAQRHILEEDQDATFANPVIVYEGTATQWTVPLPGKAAGTYYYRVRGHNEWGSGEPSNVQGVSVLLPATPVLHDIDNPSGAKEYDVTWNGAARATGYTLQEDQDENFNSPATVYSGAETTWPATEKAPGKYHYRVRANGPTGDSGWSDVKMTEVLRFRADDASLTAGQCTTLRWSFSGIKALYISFGYGYDKEGVAGNGTREVCPSVTTTYEALEVKTDNSQRAHYFEIEVNGDGCGDPVIERFAPTTYWVDPGQAFTIYWDVECAETVRLIQGGGAEEPVVGHGSREIVLYNDTMFQLKVEKNDGNFVYASFTVYVSAAKQ